MIIKEQEGEFLKRELAWKVCRWFLDNSEKLNDTIYRIVYNNARETLIDFFEDYYPSDSKSDTNIIIDMIVDTIKNDIDFCITHEIIQLFIKTSG